MRLFERLSYRGKNTAITTITAAVALILACGALAVVERQGLRRELVRDLNLLADVLGSNSAAALAFNDADAGAEVLAALRARPGITRAYLFDAQGDIVARFEREPSATPAPVTAPAAGHDFRGERLVVHRTIGLGSENLGAILVESDLVDLTRRLGRHARAAAIVALLAGLIAFLVSSHLQSVVARPILRLAGAARRISSERDYSVRVPRAGSDELGILTDDFNGMLEQIQSRDAALLEAHALLERRVEERTAALRRSEEQLRQAQKMEAVGTLAGGVAHDFNNLLTAISGYTELIRGEAAAGGCVADYAAEVSRATERAATLTRQLLAFSRRQQLSPRVLDLATIVLGMRDMLGRLIGEHIELVTELHGQDSPTAARIRADSGQLEQVLLNLAVNARDAMPRGGRLLVETREVELDDAYVARHPVVAPGRYVMLAVSDSGVGMSREVQSRIFEPFFTTKSVGEGTGLGLSMVYGIVKQSGGYIWVYSEEGHGTTFKVYLPVCRERDEPSTAAASALEPSGGVESILLVEDEPQVRLLAKRVLERQGYRVELAEDGAQAVELARDGALRIDLMISDVVMPRLNGPEAYARIAALRPGLEVIYMSGYTGSKVAHDGLLQPGLPFLQKPFSSTAMLSLVREVLDRRCPAAGSRNPT